VYTFCSAHKQLVPTFEMLKSSVESMTRRYVCALEASHPDSSTVEIEDVARIKSLCPELIHFAYIDEESTDLFHDRDTRSASRKRKDKVYEQLAAAEASGSAPRPARTGYVLLFEFADRSVETVKATASGRIPKRRKASGGNGGSAPDLDIVQTIQRRNASFERAVNELLAACAASGDDPVKLVYDAAAAHVPICPGAPRDAPLSPRTKRERFGALLSDPNARPSIVEVLQGLKEEPWWQDQIVPGGRRTFPAHEAEYAELATPLPEALARALQATHNVHRLYTHQAAAIDALERGEHVVVSTGTSSGKSLVYQLPIALALEREASATALCMFPTKALAQDQLQSLRALLGAYEPLEDVLVSTYDGDTATEDRFELRSTMRVCFTNPDMLHQSILPQEERWRRFFRGLRIVVLDELHVYSGVFGSHVALVLRRLRRICAALGNDSVRFVSCSATIARPAEHMGAMLGVDAGITAIEQDGAPHGAKEWAVWNAPLIDAHDPSQGRVSTYAEASRLFRHLVQRGVRTILFAKVRRTAEIVLRQIREDLVREDRAEVADRVVAYRSGYSVADRRRIEQDMFHGRIAGIVATSALELGVDIGRLDAVVMLGMPYTLASMWQQAGRAGRRNRDALVVLLGDPFPVDQFYMNNPELVFTQRDPPLVVDVNNELVLEAHVKCAALEVPIAPSEDVRYFGPRLPALCAALLERDGHGFYHYTDAPGAQPARELPLRGARQTSYTYVDATPGQPPRTLEEVEVERAIFEAFEGAVFLHQGVTYICTAVQHELCMARFVRANVRYHTRPRDHTDTDAVETWRIRTLPHADVYAYFGRVTISSHVWGYYKVDRRAQILDTVDVETPPLIRHTQGVWVDVPWAMVNEIAAHGINASAAIHAAEHAVLSLTPLFVASVSQDVQTECKVGKREYGGQSHPTRRKRPSRLIFFDKPGQTASVSARVFRHMDSLLRIALEVIEACGCVDGCPGCVETQACTEDNAVSSKHGARAVLRGLLRQPMFDEHDPPLDEQGHATSYLGPRDALTHTLCDAQPVPTAPDTEVHVEEITEDDTALPDMQQHAERPAPRLSPEPPAYVETVSPAPQPS